jgi:hypothetical protein
MDSPLLFRESFEDEGQKLKACEENLRRHQLALAGRLVGAPPCMKSTTAWQL